VTVVFCDLAGSTKLGESLDPESVRHLITRYFDAMRDALERHGGTVEKFIGDAVMAVFGVPAVREDDALRAVRAAVEMRSALGDLNEQLERRWGVRLRVRTGVNTGEVVAGDASRGQGFATGDAVNVAARLEQAAEAGQVLIGEHTYELVRDDVRVEPVAPLELKGKSEPVPAFRLVDLVDRPVGLGRPARSPLVGRERELGLLRAAFERAVAERACRLVTVVGPAGVGKSRLLEEFTRPLRGAATIVAGRCLSYGDGLSFWPLREMMETLAGADDGDSSEQTRARIARLLPAGDEETEVVVERIAGALGLSDQAASPEETSWAVRRLLESAAAERPLVVVFEDVHWGESTFLDLIESMAAAIRGVPVLIVAIARSDLLDRRPGFAGDVAGATVMEVAALSGADSRELIENLIGEAGATSDLPDRVLTAGEGNPLFVEELVRMLLDAGRLRRDRAGYSWVPGSSPVSVPPTIDALLAARLDRLEPAESAAVGAAAVVGRSFGPGAVLELTRGEDPGELDRRLRELARKDLIHPDGGRFAGEGTYSFKHILVRDVAYGRILKETRADLHERFAGWLEGIAGERAGEYEEILGYHLERAHRYLAELGPLDLRGRDLAGRAAARLGSSGRRALARGDIGPAVQLLERAISLMDDDDPGRSDLSLKLGIALAETGQLTRADQLLRDRLEADRRGRTFVVFHDAGGSQRVVDLAPEESPITVGRETDSDVALSWDPEVSRRHAELRCTREGWALVDEGSRNGSSLNGQPVRGRHPLRDGDVLRFGDTVVLFRAPAAGGEPGPAAPVEPGQMTSLGGRAARAPQQARSDTGPE